MTDLALPIASHSPVGPAGSALAAIAGELVGHVLAELPALAALDDRDRLLASAWLTSLRRRAPGARMPGICSAGGRG
jgi:hypothetical protein